MRAVDCDLVSYFFFLEEKEKKRKNRKMDDPAYLLRVENLYYNLD